MRQLIAIAIVLLAGSAQAATIVITASGLTQKETDATAWKVQQINAQRAVANLPPYANLKAYFEAWLTTEVLPAIVKEHAQKTQEQANIRELWENATPAQRAAAVTALGG